MASGDSNNYQVVARQYRPQGFEDLVGQSMVATALGNAIRQNRVGHAYLFTGTRGVGKTSTARIFAKCLNCKNGPATTPCNECDICQSITAGGDVDVLEIDGASNRGIDEIRQLRSNVNIRPSRARNKIYIIDEVHMLTGAAFNALLKTLEEPPGHVKFIFCTTDPEKIPITVTSRCQRFDFPPIRKPEIQERLRLIVDKKGVEADDEALELLARRANGSMRDSQSLLEQLLSFSTGAITLAQVHELLGTADNTIVLALAACITDGNAADALGTIHSAIESGVDAGQLTEQLLGTFRDALAAQAGCGDDLMLHSSSEDMDALREVAARSGPESLLAILQVMDQALSRMRYSSWTRTLLETAVVRSCHLNNLDLVPQLIEQLQSGGARGTTSPRQTTAGGPIATSPVQKAKAPKKKPLASDDARATQGLDARNDRSGDGPPRNNLAWDASRLGESWNQFLATFNDLTADAAGNFDSIELNDDRLVVTLRTAGDHDLCGRPEPRRRLEEELGRVTGRKLRLDFQVGSSGGAQSPPPPALMSASQKARQLEKDEFVRAASTLFGGEITGVRPPRP